MPVDVIIYALMFLAQQMRNSIWPGGGRNTNNNGRESLSNRADKRADHQKVFTSAQPKQNLDLHNIQIYPHSGSETQRSEIVSLCILCVLCVLCEFNGCNDKRQNSNCGYLVRKAFDVLYAQAMNF